MGEPGYRTVALELTVTLIILSILVGLTLTSKQTNHLDENKTAINTDNTLPTSTSTQRTPGNNCTTSIPPIYNISIDLNRACMFLENQELDNTGLLVASNGDNPDSRMIYLLHDNFLAWKALSVCKSGLADKVKKALDEYNVTDDPRYMVLFGKPYGFLVPPNNLRVIAGVINYENKTYTIAIDGLNTSSPLNNWRRYADWVALMGINYLWKGNTSAAIDMYGELQDLWEGHGFRDPATRDSYETYKVALAVYLTRLMKSYGLWVNDTLLDEWRHILASLQAGDGGFYTNYRIIHNTVIHAGSENVETTSLVIISLYYEPTLRQCR